MLVDGRGRTGNGAESGGGPRRAQSVESIA